jgi:replicative DNA helicase
MTAVAMAPTATVLPMPAIAPVGSGGSLPAVVYKFDENFQEKIVAMCMRDPTFMQQTDGLIIPNYFESVVHQALVNVGVRYFGKYHKCPGDKITIGMLIKDDVLNKVMTKELAGGCIQLLKDRTPDEITAGIEPGLFQADISDREFVVESVATFARHQAVSQAILDSVGYLDSMDFARIEKGLKTALDVGSSADGEEYDYGAEIENRTTERLDRAAGKLPPTGITTGQAKLDALLHQKGWGRKELSVLLGGAKAGKSTALLDFGISAAMSIQKANVLYITLELSAAIAADRLDARVSHTRMDALAKSIHTVKGEVERQMKNAGKFIIREYPAGTMRPSDLRRLIERYKARGIRFDMIVLDYGDLMMPEIHTDSTTENSKSVYVALRAIAQQEDLAMLTATQTNRAGGQKLVIRAEDVAEDFNKIRIADIVISINVLDEERTLQQARLYFAACRNQEGNITVRIAQDRAAMTFIKDVIGVE